MAFIEVPQFMNNLRWLIYLYPRSWRERYQEEFIALLEQYQNPRIVDIFDIILGAIDAQIQAAVQNKINVLPSPLKEGIDSPPGKLRNRASHLNTESSMYVLCKKFCITTQ
jgi:hypothetical protein